MRGRFVNPPPNHGFSVVMTPEEPLIAGRYLNAFVDPARGTFVFRGITPGRYQLRADVNWREASGASKSMTAGITVDVGNSDIDGLELTMESAATIEVVSHGAPGAADSKDLPVYLRRRDGAPRLIRGRARRR